MVELLEVVTDRGTGSVGWILIHSGTVENLGNPHVGGPGESEILISPLRAIDQSPLAHEQALDEVAYTACDSFISLTFDAPMPTPDRAERSLAREPERRDTESESFLQAMGRVGVLRCSNWK